MFIRSFKTSCKYFTPIILGVTLNYNRKVIAEPDSSESDLFKKDVIKNRNLDNLAIVSGTVNKKLASKVSSLLGTSLSPVDIQRFSDGEIFCKYDESIRGKNVIVIQSCAAPVNDNIMELLLLVSAARRSGAQKVTAVIPYFGYKYHKRGSPISTKHQSRFLWSAASDFAKLLQTSGVDMIISVDLQRPGQGHEACFFDCSIPVETINSTRIMAEYFKENITFENPVVVVASKAACAKKAISFSKFLGTSTESLKIKSDLAVVFRSLDPIDSEFLGNVEGCDVVIIDDIVDTAVSISALCHKVKNLGAEKIYVCASHGLFTGNAKELIDLSPVEKVIVTDSIPLSSDASKKVLQLPMAPLLAHIIETEYFLSKGSSEDQEQYDTD